MIGNSIHSHAVVILAPVSLPLLELVGVPVGQVAMARGLLNVNINWNNGYA